MLICLDVAYEVEWELKMITDLLRSLETEHKTVSECYSVRFYFL